MWRLALAAVLGVAFFQLIVEPAFATDTAQWSGQTEATIHATAEPGAVAEVRFYNAPVNNQSNTGETATITLGDIAVTLRFQWNDDGDADRIDADPGPDLIALPQFLTIPEGSSGRILIYPREGLGM